ncbi:MAG TPA: cation:proton antiporter [Gammaproteobacteria bacterium]
MHSIEFIQDLAIVMLIAGITTVIFHRLKQPVVLGYIVAGVIIGPYTPPFQLIQDEYTIKTLAELGIVFLLFSLGLEFSLRKLARVGAAALVAAVAEIVLMIWIGYEIGRFFDWNTMDSIFLGAILAISSTTIIVKALDELGMKRERFAQLIFGILIIEDILAIAIIALLSAIAITGEVNASTVFSTVGKLSLFIVVALVLGILIVPRLLAYVAKFESDEMLLVTVLGLCFGFCLVAIKLDYSIALGAFVIGAIMAESRELRTIERLIGPIRDMFSAIFFVVIGLLLDPRVLVEYAWPVTVITIAVILGKVLTCSLGTFITGYDGRTSIRVGMGLAQIGEFSFIIATLGVTLEVTSAFLYPIAVAVSAVTTLLTPYLIRLADPLSAKIASAMPERAQRLGSLYTNWLQNIGPNYNDRAGLALLVRRSLLQVLINCVLVIAIFIAGAYLGDRISEPVLAGKHLHDTVVWFGALLISLPFLIATYRKLKALSMLLAELGVNRRFAKQYTDQVRRIVAEIIPAAAIAAMLVLVAILSASILPPMGLLILVLVAAAALVFLLWDRLVKLHSRLQIALIETLEAKDKNKNP